jgi:RimJ/RimL family protein N-acetyltransferase
LKLIPIEIDPDAPRLLFDLLAERRADQSISHERMPTFVEHCSFVRDHPYEAWYLVEHGSDIIGAIYLSKRDEIGVSLFERFTNNGLGGMAADLLMATHGKRRYLANVAPRNEPSRKMWAKKGFKHIQDTYALAAG